MGDDPEPVRRKSLLFRAWHRGTREAGSVVRPFRRTPSGWADAGQLDRFEQLLEAERRRPLRLDRRPRRARTRRRSDVVDMLLTFSNPSARARDKMRSVSATFWVGGDGRANTTRPARSLRLLSAPSSWGAGQRIMIAGAPEGYDAFVLGGLVAAGKAETVLHIALTIRGWPGLRRRWPFSHPGVEAVVFPAWDCLPYDRVSPHVEIVARRVDALAKLAHAQPATPAAGW